LFLSLTFLRSYLNNFHGEIVRASPQMAELAAPALHAAIRRKAVAEPLLSLHRNQTVCFDKRSDSMLARQL
jgi:hypothetical protein